MLHITQDQIEAIAEQFKSQLNGFENGSMECFAYLDNFNAYANLNASSDESVESHTVDGGHYSEAASVDTHYEIEDLWLEDEDCNEVLIVDQLDAIRRLTKHLN